MRVLVVEDDPGMASVLGRGLAENGYAVDVSRTGGDGIWLGTEQDYDVIVLDVGLPDVDGLTVLGRLREAGRGGPWGCERLWARPADDIGCSWCIGQGCGSYLQDLRQLSGSHPPVTGCA